VIILWFQNPDLNDAVSQLIHWLQIATIQPQGAHFDRGNAAIAHKSTLYKLMYNVNSELAAFRDRGIRQTKWYAAEKLDCKSDGDIQQWHQESNFVPVIFSSHQANRVALRRLRGVLNQAGISTIDDTQLPPMWSDVASFWFFSCHKASVVIILASEEYWHSPGCCEQLEYAQGRNMKCVAVAVDTGGRATAEATNGITVIPKKGLFVDEPRKGEAELVEWISDATSSRAADVKTPHDGGYRGIWLDDSIDGA